MTGTGRTIELEVVAIPPVKQAPADAAERTRQQHANAALGAAFHGAYPSWRIYPLPSALDLTIEYERGVGRSDSANIIGGIADQLERFNAYHNDRQLRRIRYEERASTDGVDRYRLQLGVIEAPDI